MTLAVSKGGQSICAGHRFSPSFLQEVLYLGTVLMVVFWIYPYLQRVVVSQVH